MLKRVLMALLTVVAVAGFAQVANAQYMWLDANANGVHDTGDRLNANGTPTVVDVYVRTNTNRDGSTVICNDNPATIMTINQYQVNLLAVGGTVTYTNFINQQAGMTFGFGEFNPGDGVRYKNGFGGGTQLAPGTYRVMTITITGTGSSPRVDLVDQVAGSPDFTGFGTACSGQDFDSLYKLDGPNVLAATGHPGDFFDADGLTAAGGVNNPPVLGAIGNKTVNELATLAFTATATDPDAGQTLTFSLDAGAPAGATIGAASGAFSWTPTEAQGPGSFPITVRVTDNATAPANDFETITVTVNEVNVAPVVTNPGNKITNELANLAFTVTATDADIPANTIAWSLTLGTPAATGATIGAGTGAFSWTPTEAQGPGTYPVTIVATDNGTPALSGNAAITITVNEVNVAPVVTNPGNRTTAELANLAFTVTATDADVPANTIAWSLTLGTPAATGATIGAGTGAFSWTPTEAQGPGTYPVTIVATDNGTPALSGNAAITITVTEVNVAPVVTSPGNRTTAELANLAFTVTATDADVPANTIAWSLTLGTPAATGATIGAGTGAFSWTPTEAQGPGTYPVTIVATDNGTPALSGNAAITITVTEVNVAPVVTNPGNRTTAELANLAFTVTATDADVPANTIAWSLTLGTPAATGATIGAGTGAFSWTPTEAQGPGTYPVTIVATDNGTPSLSGNAAITITVTEVNVAPVLAPIGNKSGTTGSPITFTATATDADLPANTLTFSLDAGAPAGATIGATTGAFSWTPSANGTFPVTVRVTDNGTPALSAFEAIQITVNPTPNTAPVLGAIGNKTVNELATLTFTATATDSDVPAQTLTFSLDAGAPAGATIGASSGAFSWTPTEAQGPASTPITVRVTDNGTGNLSDSELITVTVNEVNVAPVVTNPGNKTTAELANLAFTVTATDADIPANTIAWSLTLGTPAATGATIGAGTGAFSWTPTEAQGPGTYPVTIVATDNGTPALSGNAAITITVTEVNVAPVVANPGNQTVNELATLAFTATATDADVPANTIAWSLTLGTPAATGATIGAGTGAFSWTPTEAQGPGTYPVTIVATDNGTPALSGSAAITITVNEVNVAPVVTNPGNKTTAELANLAFTVTATDADVPANTIAWSLTLGTPAATGATIGAGTGAFSWTPTEAQGPGTYPVTIVATDNGTPALSGSAAITIAVTEVNSAPVVTNPGNRTTNELVNVAFTVTATDSDVPANTIAWSLTLGTPAATGATIGAGTGAFSWTPTEAQGPGVYPVTIVATDNGTPALSGNAAITITVNEVNAAPVLAAIGNKTVNELVALTFTATATDADLPAQTLTFSLDAGAPAGATIGASTGAFSWTPTEAQGPSSNPITVRVTDNGTPAMSASELITVTVNEVNVAPVVTNPGNRTTAELVNLAFTVTATDADIPANTITWSLTLGTPAATGATIAAGTGAFSWTPTEAQGPGTYPVTIVATDNGTPALSGNAAITITVTEVNVAPVLAAIGNKAGTIGTPITFTATATDADVPANTLTFSLDAGAPAGATIGATTGAFSWTPSANGTFPVTVRVTDNGTPALNDFEVISINVSPAPNTAPVLGAIGNKTVNELATLTFTATATDSDVPAQTLTFSLDAGAPAGATIGASSGAFSWTPTEAQGPASTPITVRVTDNGTGNLSDTETITVTVNEVNVAPVVTNPGNKTTAELANLAFTVTATDADIPANTIAWSLTLGTPAATGATINPSTGAFSWTPTEAQGPGTYPVTIVATDNGTPALSGNAAITVTVTEVNVAPVVANPGNQTVNELATLAFTATATDADVPANTIAWSLTLGTPAATGATIGAGTGAFSWTPTEAQGPGTYPVTIVATDNGTPALSGSAAITITVNEVNVAPVVTNPGNKTTAELANLAFTVTATDADVPANTIAWSLTLGTPAATGATIGAGTGAFSWTPTEAQGPGTYPVTIVATDNGTPALSGNAAITITVTEVNVAPVLAAIGNKTGTVGVATTFTATATDADVPANTLTFSLDAGAPAGATIGGATGAFSWTPSAAGTFPVTVRVTDNGTPALSAFEAISITVGAAPNQAPVLGAIGNKTVAELATLAFTATATDPNSGDVLTFSLDAGSPAGATINGSTGAFSWTPTEAQGPGSFPITVRVTDNGSPAMNDFEAITVTVTEVNVAPVLAAIGNKTGTVGVATTFTATATDADIPANTLTFSLDAGAPAGATIGGATGAFSWTPSAAGTFPVTVRVTDNGTPALNDFEAISITVGAAANQAPVLGAIGNKTVNELATLAFTATATDPDAGQTLTFSLDAGAPASATIGGASGAFSWTPTEAQGPGSFPITVRVTDNGSPALNDFEAITVTVNEVNSAPVVTNPGNKTTAELALLAFTVTATDSDLPANTIAWSLTLGTPAATGATIGAGTGAFSWTPTEAQGLGTYPVTITATDNGTPALSGTAAITITVTEVNAAPVLAAIGNKTVNELATLTFTATATDSDVPANTLTFSLDAGAPAGAAITTGGAFSWTPTEAQGPSSNPITVRVTDNGTPALSASELITVTVNEVNVAPVVTNPGNKTTAELANLAFTVTATDSDLPAQTITWSLDAGAPAGATIGAATGAFSWTPTEAQGPGTFPVTIRATDNGPGALSGTAAITITVTEVNVAPVLAAIGNKSGTVAVPITFTATATDADIPANTLTFSLDAGAPAGATIGAATGAFSWTPSAAGSFPVTVRVTDNGTPALSAFEAITITVGAAANQAPVLGAIGNKTVAELATLTFTATATDPNSGDVLTFSLDAGAPAGATIGGASGAFSWTPTEAQGPSSNPITVRVTDNGSPVLSDFETITVTVNEVNVAPVLAAIGNKTTNEQSLLTFVATATDADIPANSLTFSLDAGAPAGAAITAGGTFSWTPTEAQGPGSYPVTVRVTDNGTPAMNAFEAITITVNEVNVAPVLAVITNKTVNQGSNLTFTATATDSDIPANALTFSLDAGAPSGATITSGGVFSWTPPTAGTFPVTVRVTDNGVPALSDAKSFTITVQGVNHAPTLTQPADMTVSEGATADQPLSATDPDAGDVLTNSKVSGPAFMTVDGSIHLAPGSSDAGTYTGTVRVTDNGVPPLSDTKSFQITVLNANSAPTADADGPYSGGVGANISFDGTGSSDPDGDALTFAWDFGDGGTGTGATPVHAYATDGVFNVSLRVTDPDGLYDDDTTTATIRAEIQADIVLENDSSTIDVKKTGSRTTTVGLEQQSLPYTDLLLNSIRISHTGPAGFVTECAPDSRYFVIGDLDGDGILEANIRFTNKCLSNMFNNVPTGSVATVVLTGEFSSGGSTVPLNAERDLTIIVKHRNTPILVIASPNPFNPETAISYTVKGTGAVTMKIYSVDGRLVRTLKQGEETTAGTHETTWNGTDDSGNHVSSGIYFVKTTQKVGATEESATLKLALTK